ncbi:hypothetical protein CRUP_008988 [Coryphaenoides rupestris]|nr:hypothetical protein CRUP_008988 [Coryphaenoides rupestris]
MVALCLVGLLLWLSLQPPAPLSKDVQLFPQSHERPPATTRRSLNLWPPCHRNLSVVNITGFSELPDRLQNFLPNRRTTNGDKSSGRPGPRSGCLDSQGVHLGDAGDNFEKWRMNKLMEFEHRKHRDILQSDFQESFLNLTLKQVLFLEWLQDRCPRVHFLLNGDDDIFAHTDNMVQYLQSIPEHRHGVGHHLYDGQHSWWAPGPFEEQQVFSRTTILPEATCCPAITRPQVLYEMSKYVPLHPIDDAYMGMCLARAGLEPSGHLGVKPWGLKIPSSKMDPFDPCFYTDVLMVHSFLPHQMYVLWHQVHDSELRC